MASRFERLANEAIEERREQERKNYERFRNLSVQVRHGVEEQEIMVSDNFAKFQHPCRILVSGNNYFFAPVLKHVLNLHHFRPHQ